MNTARYLVSRLLESRQDLYRWLVLSLTGPNAREHANDGPCGLGALQQAPGGDEAGPEPCSATAHSVVKPLRVIRVLEMDHAPSNVGRMVISGRMTDVCAELDRLAACQAALH